MLKIKSSGFSLAKGKQLSGDDFYDVKSFENLTIGVVCDGVGSADEGAQAAQRVTKYLMTNFKNRPSSWSIEKSIKKFITSINSILYEESMVNYERCELVTTLTIVVLFENRLHGANVGDSRVYIKRDDEFLQLSNDHSMDEKGYENVLTQAIGLSESVEINYFENMVNVKDKILLCSDGLYNTIDDLELSKGTSIGAHHLVKKASVLSNDELDDDTTAVVIDVIEMDEVCFLKEQKLIIPEYLKKNQQIDGYILKKSLIQNDRTWLCEKKGKNYVLKFPTIEAQEDEQLLDLFVNEAWNAKRLKAGFFPKAVIPKNRTYRYYVMEAIDGINLKEHLKKRVLSIDDTILLAKTLLKASQYLLKYDLVHGDIKPENIMMMKRDGKSIFKIIDFGSICEIYSIASRAGTPSYLSPQRFSGSSISEGSEVYAIGVTLYESLSNKFPYGEIEPFQTPNFRLKKELKKLNNNIPNWLNSVILRSIAVDENLRYENFSAMTYELENSNKVKPFFNKDTPLIQKDPLKFYQYGFYFMIALYILTIFHFNQ
ncbi:MAG: protein phosphatase 2C domain-containing protein [Campylobacterota bacterium]|nr:protein phosphatase 2C domain-containing protein [Campylobacterota bacterium]